MSVKQKNKAIHLHPNEILDGEFLLSNVKQIASLTKEKNNSL